MPFFSNRKFLKAYIFMIFINIKVLINLKQKKKKRKAANFNLIFIFLELFIEELNLNQQKKITKMQYMKLQIEFGGDINEVG